MKAFLRILAILGILFLSTVAWLALGAIGKQRTHSQHQELQGRVADLWGSPHAQAAPTLTLNWDKPKTVGAWEDGDWVRSIELVPTERAERPRATRVNVALGLDQRLKGLVWYPLYDVDFAGEWVYENPEEDPGRLKIHFEFPNEHSLYDGFSFRVNGVERAAQLSPKDGVVEHEMAVAAGEVINFRIAYKSRGMESWTYAPSTGVANQENFALSMNTDFADIDFPPFTMSPSTKTRTATGWQLDWNFEQVVTGHKIGMQMPTPVQPGELASSLAFTAPISLLFFFLVVYVLALRRGVDIHPVNYFFLAASFFAFHLLFAYLVDHLRVVPAFTVCSVVSIVLVVSYMRLVVSGRFAIVETALSQLLYLVGFSLAHFWDGFTGLTVTVLSILTLFLMMQLTGRTRWAQVFGGREPEPTPAE